MRSALILGVTGLVGGNLLRRLLDDSDYEHVTILARRPLQVQNAKFHGVLANYEKLEGASVHFAVDDVFCCLGTTIKTAGSREAFRKVDYDYVVHAAQLSRAAGARQFLVVSALGADASSSVFYNRVKGEMEDAVRAIDLPSVHIFRPSLLLGRRPENRTGERIAQSTLPIFHWMLLGPLRKYRAIRAVDVADAMILQAKKDLPGVHIYESDRIGKLPLAEAL